MKTGTASAFAFVSLYLCAIWKPNGSIVLLWLVGWLKPNQFMKLPEFVKELNNMAKDLTKNITLLVRKTKIGRIRMTRNSVQAFFPKFKYRNAVINFPGSYFFNTSFWGELFRRGVIFYCHLCTSDERNSDQTVTRLRGHVKKLVHRGRTKELSNWGRGGGGVTWFIVRSTEKKKREERSRCGACRVEFSKKSCE